MSSPVVAEWYVPVSPLFYSEAEGGGRQKTNTEAGGGGEGGAENCWGSTFYSPERG